MLMASNNILRQRFRGCLLGLAVGDALGTSVEFRPPGTFEPVEDMIGGGPFGLKPGQWTDDTSMALCLAESLIECSGFDMTDQMQRYLRWYRNGYLSSTGHCFDIGITIRRALEKYEKTGDPAAGSADPDTAGNGSLMRLAPVAMFFANQPRRALDTCAESSRTTHAAEEAVDACRYFGALLVGALTGVDKDTLLSHHYCPASGYWEERPLCQSIAAIAGGSFKRHEPPAIKGTGYVVKSLEAALWAFHKSRTFDEGVLLAANLGDDADTTAAIYGQLAGACYGVESIRQSWRDRLHQVDFIIGLADRLHR
jgi:ADP-ribosyl-[dinitrogen reductase] hydrolase